MPASDYKRLEERLVLVAWLNGLFGYAHNRDLLKDLVDVGEGVDSTGRSHVVSRLLSRGEKCTLSEAELVRYDQNIRRHLAKASLGEFLEQGGIRERMSPVTRGMVTTIIPRVGRSPSKEGW